MSTPRTTRTYAAACFVGGAALVALTACGGGSTSGSASGSGSASSAPLPSVSADATLAGQVPEAIKSTGKLSFGTDASYAPNEFIGPDGTTIEGFDIDLGNAIAQKLGLQATWANAGFDSLIVGVTNGKYNSSMSSFTITPEREQQVNMISYFNAGTQWAVAKGNPQKVSIDDACGKSVGVQKATVQVPDIEARSAKCTSAGKQAIDIQQFNLQSDVTTAVTSGKVDAMLADSPVIGYAVQQSPQLEALGDVYDSAPYGVVIPKDQAAFAATVQSAVQSLIDDGSYKKIVDKWGIAQGAISKSELNPSQS